MVIVAGARQMVVEVKFSLSDGGEGGIVDEMSLTQTLLVARRRNRWLAVEPGSEAGPVGIGYTLTLAILDYLKNRIETE